MSNPAETPRWSAHPWGARLLRGVVFVAPIAASIAFVHLASRALPPPTTSFWLYGTWWLGLSGAATLVLLGVDRVARRLLPLAALLRLSLVFPDATPSRFKAAMRAGTVGTLAERIEAASHATADETDVEAAERLLSLVAALDAHDALTRGHSERVRAYSQLIANELGLSPPDRDRLNWSALLHDVGKLLVPTEILTKSGRPTDEEWQILRSHPERGAELVLPLRGWLDEWTDAVPDHHERWDGNGYPNGTAGESISLAGRIVAVADVFDVITSARSYKSASDAVAARSEIAACAGTQFDPRVVRALLGISLGRLRLAMGPLSWLAHAPILGRLPLTPAIGAASGALAAATAAVATGLVATPPAARSESAAVPAVATAPGSERPAPSVDEPAPPAPARDETRTPRPPSVVVAAPVGSRPAAPSPEAPPAGDTEPPPAAAPANRLPAPVDDDVEAREDAVVLADVLANDGDPDGDTLALVAVGDASAGSAEAVGNRIRWTPAPDFSGRAEVSYTVGDEHDGRASARLVIRVTAANDPPVAADDSASTPEDIPVTVDVAANDFDVDGDRLTVLDADAPVGAAAVSGRTVTYTPPANWSGPAVVSYVVSDGRGETDTAALTVTVAPVDDAPLAVADTVVVLEGGSVDAAVLANDVDVDGGALTLTSITPPALGSAAIVGDSIRYTAPNAGGTTTVPYTVTDAAGATATGVLHVAVVEVNDAPSFVVGADRVVVEDAGAQSVAGWASSVNAGPADESGQSVSFLLSSDNPALFAAGPAVAADGSLSFTPAADAWGSATVTVRARDDGGTANGGTDTSAPQTFTITVTPVNDAPSFLAGADQLLAEDAGAQSIAGWASALDAGPGETGQTLSFLLSSDNPALFAAGPAVAADGSLSFTPAADTSGSATVTVRARDDGGTSNGGADTSTPQTFTITITAVQDAPVAVDDAAATDEQTPVTFDVLANDTDADGDVRSLDAFDASTVANGMVTSNGGGSFTYAPNAGFVGTETFTYTVSDGQGGLDQGTVTLTVNDVEHVPDAVDDAYTIEPATTLSVPEPGLLDNDSDHDADTLSVTVVPVADPANGVVTLGADGAFVYTPNIGFSGADTFQYRIDDGTGRTDVATVTIVVSATATAERLYLHSSGSSADTWDMTSGAPAGTGGPVPDWDGDGFPGLLVKSSGGGENESDPLKWQEWVAPAPAAVNGPVTLHLEASARDFALKKDLHPHIYLYDCNNALTNCTRILAADVHISGWSGLLGTWVARDVLLGPLSHTFLPGRTLRMRLLVGHSDAWVALTGERPSWLELTLP